jgi:hypothetical protein
VDGSPLAAALYASPMRQRRPSPARPGVPELAILIVLVLLVAGGLLLGGGSGDAEPQRTVVSAERLARVEAEVERIRGLDFKRPVSVEVMTPEEVRAYAEGELDASARREIEAGGELTKLLGLVEPGYDFAGLAGDLFGEQVAGFYDTDDERLVLVEGVGIDDVTLAHELTHALEDQHYDLGELGDDGDGGVVFDGDASTGETGLVEGTATLVMTRYLERNPDAVSLGDAFGQLLTASGARPLPASLMRSLVFPYMAGERFAQRLYDTTGDWRLLDNALRHRPPLASADLIDPDRWLRVVRPERVPLPAADAPGPGWRRLTQTTSGEFDLRELLRDAVGERRAARLASSWTGAESVLWRRGPLPAGDCAAPCRARDALALRIRVDSPAAARRLGVALTEWLWETLGADAIAGGSETLRIGPDGLARLAVRGREIRIAMAPEPALLAKLMR